MRHIIRHCTLEDTGEIDVKLLKSMVDIIILNIYKTHIVLKK